MRNHSYENEFDLHENETACRTHFHIRGTRELRNGLLTPLLSLTGRKMQGIQQNMFPIYNELLLYRGCLPYTDFVIPGHGEKNIFRICYTVPPYFEKFNRPFIKIANTSRVSSRVFPPRPRHVARRKTRVAVETAFCQTNAFAPIPGMSRTAQLLGFTEIYVRPTRRYLTHSASGLVSSGTVIHLENGCNESWDSHSQ